MRTRFRDFLRGAAVAGVLVFAGCDQDRTDAAMRVERQQAGESLAREAAGADDAGLRRMADAALRDGRVSSPAGDNAVEHYLALRGRPASAAIARDALIELKPYLLIATEQALASGQRDEAARLIGLLERTDPEAPAMSRLRASYAAIEEQPSPVQEAAEAGQGVASAVVPEPAGSESSSATNQASTATGQPQPPMPAASVAVAATQAVATLEEQSGEQDPVQSPPAPVAQWLATQPLASTLDQATPKTANAPRLLSDTAPRYPLIALHRRLEGEVTVAFTVAPDGSVRNARVQGSRPARVFDQAALDAVQGWKFESSNSSHAVVRIVRFSVPKAVDG